MITVLTDTAHRQWLAAMEANDAEALGRLVAVEHGSLRSMVASVPGGADFKDRGNFVAVWRREADGSWKRARNIWNSMLPLPALA